MRELTNDEILENIGMEYYIEKRKKA